MYVGWGESNTYILFHLFFRSVLLNHMTKDHAFNIGLPDNIVNCKEFLDVLQKKIDRYLFVYSQDFKQCSLTLVNYPNWVKGTQERIVQAQSGHFN